jgi:hypothetical protein
VSRGGQTRWTGAVAKTKLSTFGNRNWFSVRLSRGNVTTAYYWAGVLFTEHSVTQCVTALPWIFCQVCRESFWNLLVRKEDKPKSYRIVSWFIATDSWRYLCLALSNCQWDTCLCCLMEHTDRFDVRGSVCHSKIHIEKSNKMQQFIKIYYSIFIWSLTCFGRHTTHHQEPKTALAASGFAYVESC